MLSKEGITLTVVTRTYTLKSNFLPANHKYKDKWINYKVVRRLPFWIEWELRNVGFKRDGKNEPKRSTGGNTFLSNGKNKLHRTYGIASVIQKKEALNPLWKKRLFLLQRHRRQDYYERKGSHKSTPIRSILQKKVQTIPHNPVNNTANLRAFCFSVVVF